VTGSELCAQDGRKRDRRLAHAEWREDAATHEVLVAHSGLERQGMAQETHAEVRVLVLRAHVTREFVAGEKRVHLLHAVVGVRVQRIARREVRRHARQSRRLGREVQQRDLPAVARGDAHRWRQELRDWIVEPHLTALAAIRERCDAGNEKSADGGVRRETLLRAGREC
jgi:hypothetical protein